MPESGGPTTTGGVNFQFGVAALYLGRLIDPTSRPLRDQVVEVRLEAPLPITVDDIVVTFADGHREYFQAKTNLEKKKATTRSAWKTLWQHFAKQQKQETFSSDDRTVLLLGSHTDWSGTLAEICKRAASAESEEEWLKSLKQKHLRLKSDISSVLPKDTSNETIFSVFAHCELRIWDPEEIRPERAERFMPPSNMEWFHLYDKLYRIAGENSSRRRIFKKESLAQALAHENVELQSESAQTAPFVPRVPILYVPSTNGVDAYIEALREIEADAPFELAPNEGFQIDDSWREKIYSCMRTTDGAVLLLDKETFDSKFAPIQHLIQSFLKCRTHSYPIVLVFVDEDGIDNTTLEAPCNASAEKIVCVCESHPADAAGTTADHLRHFFQGLKRRSNPRDTLIRKTAFHLQRADLTEADLEEAAASFSAWPHSAADGRGDHHLSFASVFFDVDMDYQLALKMFTELAGLSPWVLPGSNHEGAEALGEILRLLTPLWVEEREAIPIAEQALATNSQRLLALDVQQVWSAETFICRACSQPHGGQWKTIEIVPPSTEDDDQFFDEVKTQLLLKLDPRKSSSNRSSRRPKPSSPNNEDFVKTFLGKREKDGQPIFVVFPKGWVFDSAFLSRFQEEFRTLTVVALENEQLSSQALQRFTSLNSPDPERETSAFMDYWNAMSYLDGNDI